MKKLFTILAICLMCATTVYAQKTNLPENATRQKGNFTQMMMTTKSDILATKSEEVLFPGGFLMPCGEDVVVYSVNDPDFPGKTYMTGSNGYGDTKFGYIYKGTSGTISEVSAFLYPANNGPAENIYAEIWTINANGLPSTKLGTSNPISTAVITDWGEHVFTFSTPVTVPAIFAAVITVPEWSATGQTVTSHVICVASTEEGCYAPGTEKFLINYSTEYGWEIFVEAWGFDPGEGFVDLAIFPVVNDAVNACAPVANLNVTFTTDCKARLTWTKSPNAISYDVYRNNVFVANVVGTTYNSTVATEGEQKWEVKTVCTLHESDRFDETNTCLGINEIEKTVFSIVPNPATNNITVSADNNFHTVEVVSFLGQTILSQPNAGTSVSLDVSNLTNGVYFVRVISENGTSVKKFVKQ